MISIIIPLYNREKLIGKALDSILRQSYTDYEVIVVDDGSKDRSLAKAHEYEMSFWPKKIRYKVISQENKGAPSARNKGFRESRGDFLFFCDSDAILRKDCLEVLRKSLKKNSSAAYAYSSYKFGAKLFRGFPFSAEKLREMPYIHTMALIRREAFPASGWDENIKKLQDWDLFLTMLEEGHTGVWVDEVLFKIYPGGTISNWLPSFAYKIFPFLPSVKKYKKAVRIVKEKHGI